MHRAGVTVLVGGLCALIVAYSLCVLILVATTGDIGLRCVFGTTVEEPITASEYAWTPRNPGDPARPNVGDVVTAVGREGAFPPPGETNSSASASASASGPSVIFLHNYTDYIQSLRMMHQWHDEGVRTVLVHWHPADDPTKLYESRAELRGRPWSAWLRSLFWFLQELVILGIGLRVLWSRPKDDSARLFCGLCLITVGAYMGGYHWSDLVVSATLIYLFAGFAVFVPIVSLHFYLVFPRPMPFFAAAKRRWLTLLYGVPSLWLAALWGSMIALRRLQRGGGREVLEALDWVRSLALGYVTLAAAVYGLCVVCLIFRFRTAIDPRERNQVKWILWASLLSIGPIGYLLWQAAMDASTLGREGTAWTMFAVSLLYTIGYAMSITRYRLTQIDEILTRSLFYVVVSIGSGILYSCALVVSTLVIGDTLLEGETTRQGILAALTAILVLMTVGTLRDWFRFVLDRGYRQEKTRIDMAMRRLGETVEGLVEPVTLGTKLLESAGDVLRLDWGSVYLINPEGAGFPLAACLGPAPDETSLDWEHPLVRALHENPSSHVTLPGAFSSSDPKADALIALGGEVALGLTAVGRGLVGILVAGPKRSGLPFSKEELAFLSALSSIASLAFHSAEIQHALRCLDQELHSKVEKIAEQQRRILVLERAMRGAVSFPARGENALSGPTGSVDALGDWPTVDDVTPNGPRALRGGESVTARPLGDDPKSVWPLETETPSQEMARDPERFSEFAGRIKGASPQVREMIRLAVKVAKSPCAVLITGESGTGKELLAEVIHQASARHKGPFVKVNCAALAPNLLESELFGHVRGAFTGADRDRVGRFQQADGGTLFLDEIGDISLDLQVKMLRVLQEKSFELVGSSKTVAVDTRIVAATHQDLLRLIRQGKFREDLYYRLNVFSLPIPPLRERITDIYELATHFLHNYGRRLNKPIAHIDDQVLEILISYDWPGNIRELENVIERAVVLADGPTLTVADLPPEIHRQRAKHSAYSVRGGDRLKTKIGEGVSKGNVPTPMPMPTSAAFAPRNALGNGNGNGTPPAGRKRELVRSTVISASPSSSAAAATAKAPNNSALSTASATAPPFAAVAATTTSQLRNPPGLYSSAVATHPLPASPNSPRTSWVNASGTVDSAGSDKEWNAEPDTESDSDPADEEIFAFQRHRLWEALQDAGGNKSAAARLLGIPRSTLFSQLKKYGLL